MSALAAYCQQFRQLRRAPNSIFPELTKRRAPHKPFLLLSIMDMLACNTISNRFISINDELTELTSLFTNYWRTVMPIRRTSSIAFPFSRLHSEPFWKLVPIPGREITKESITHISSVTQLRNLALGAQLDEALFLLMSNRESRSELTMCLLEGCFSSEGREIVEKAIRIHQEAFQYSMELTNRAHHVAIPEEANVYPDAARTQGFRRAIVVAYNHRCALCGVRIVTPEGHTAVEAAHIKPWSKFKDDDIKNGMALCRLCHWAFDEGLMGVDDQYGVLTSRQMTTLPNAAGFLMTLSGRPIIKPNDYDFWPHQNNLAWHRTNIGCGL